MSPDVNMNNFLESTMVRGVDMGMSPYGDIARYEIQTQVEQHEFNITLNGLPETKEDLERICDQLKLGLSNIMFPSEPEKLKVERKPKQYADQCKGVTKTGRRCRKAQANGSDFCEIHDEPFPTYYYQEKQKRKRKKSKRTKPRGLRRSELSRMRLSDIARKLIDEGIVAIDDSEDPVEEAVEENSQLKRDIEFEGDEDE